MPERNELSPHQKRVILSGVEFDPIYDDDVQRHVLAELAAGRGGQIVTPNVDILRRVTRDEESRQYVRAANVVVADGKPLIWASRLAGHPLPARVPGSDLIWSLSGAIAERGGSVYLLGGEPGTASRAEDVLRERFPKLRIAGHLSPSFGFDTRPDEVDAVCATVAAARPDMVYVGLGFPKQERLIARLRPLLPQAWFMGCGAAIGFVAGVHQRAPLWMQRSGLEWVHRLVSEPGRLARRYLIHDVPFTIRLLAGSARARLSRTSTSTPTGGPAFSAPAPRAPESAAPAAEPANDRDPTTAAATDQP
ncbi:WecB/TagA/CpsF family glycosyltransferase [Dactylosporangium sp. NPDC000555]|uniref:WecB/TagA/CpsF family glycosyltransferase n=1 Tax=Dactylosporangium sp. NPDC000555 TaxID=3154260 RepID=UPI0033301BEC